MDRLLGHHRDQERRSARRHQHDARMDFSAMTAPGTAARGSGGPCRGRIAACRRPRRRRRPRNARARTRTPAPPLYSSPLGSAMRRTGGDHSRPRGTRGRTCEAATRRSVARQNRRQMTFSHLTGAPGPPPKPGQVCASRSPGGAAITTSCARTRPSGWPCRYPTTVAGVARRAASGGGPRRWPPGWRAGAGAHASS